jgi:cytochrome P450
MTSTVICCPCCCWPRDEHGTGLSDAELRDQLVVLLLAGHKTTATAIAWAAERLT